MFYGGQVARRGRCSKKPALGTLYQRTPSASEPFGGWGLVGNAILRSAVTQARVVLWPFVEIRDGKIPSPWSTWGEPCQPVPFRHSIQVDSCPENQHGACFTNSTLTAQRIRVMRSQWMLQQICPTRSNTYERYICLSKMGGSACAKTCPLSINH